jgi:hypothetical protein
VEVVAPLESVRRPAETQVRWGDYTISESADGVTYEDELLTLVVVRSDAGFVLSFDNKTEHSLRVLWSETTYVNYDGLASGVSAGGTTTIVPAGATVVGVARVNLVEERGGIFPDLEPATLKSAPGMEIQLIVPIQVQGVTNEYTLVFLIEEVVNYTAQLRYTAESP